MSDVGEEKDHRARLKDRLDRMRHLPSLADAEARWEQRRRAGLCGALVGLGGLGTYPCVITHEGSAGAHAESCVTQPERDGNWPTAAVQAARGTDTTTEEGRDV